MAKQKVITETDVFLNPFEVGVSYVDFKNSIPEGKTIKEHCDGILSDEEIQWIEKEIEFFDLNNSKGLEEEEIKDEN